MKYCSKCGAQLQDNEKYCPSCGAPQDMNVNYNQYNANPHQTNGMAIASFVLSLVGIFLNGFFLIPSILGLILGLIGYSNSKKGMGGGGMAIAGIVISIVVLAIYIIIILFAVTTATSYYGGLFNSLIYDL